MKVAQDINVDNTTIVINRHHQLESPHSKDTGLVQLTTTPNVADGAWLKLRRIGNVVFLYAGGLRWDLWGVKGKTEKGFALSHGATYPSRIRLVAAQGIPMGFRADASTIFSTFEDDSRSPKGSIYIGGVKDSNWIGFDFQGEVPDEGWKNLRVPITSWTTSDPFPDL